MASNESQTHKLIGLYRSCECLWNPHSPGYLSSSVQEDAWRKITRRMNCGLTPDQVKLQVLALRNYYDAECAAIRQSKLGGYSYEPRHSYFNDLLFLDKVLPEETEEDCTQSKYPKNFSEATVIQSTDFLCKRTNDTQPDYTFYKLILEPEKPLNYLEMKKGAVTYKSRTTSGNDRWYPTSYCVPCKKKKPGCRSRYLCTDSDSESSVERCCPRRPKSLYGNKCCSCTSMGVSHVHSRSSMWCCPPSENQKSRCRYAEPGPKLCCQSRPCYIPKCHPIDTGRDKSCCVNNWKRNNKAVVRRLKAQLNAQEAENAVCAGQEIRNTLYRCNERRRSGEDQMHPSSQHGSTNYPPGSCPPCINNNQQDLDYGRCNQQGVDPGNYCDNQQIPDSNTYMTNQQMQQRYNNEPQGQQMFSNSMYYQMQPGKPNYYQSQQQCTQSTMNSTQPMNMNKPVQQYVNNNYVPYQPLCDYGRSTIPDQTNVYNCGVENTCGQLQSPGPVPVQRPLTCLPPQQDVQICQGPCSASRTAEQDNRYSVDTGRYTEQPSVIGACNVQQDNDEPPCSCVNKRDRQWQSDDPPRNHPTRICNQNQGRYTDDEMDTQRRRLNDCDQDQRQRVSRKVDGVDCVSRTRSYDQMDRSSRSRAYYDESPNRRGWKFHCPQDFKAFQLPTDDSSTPCPPNPPCRRAPRDCYMPQDRGWYDREDRIARKTRPPPRKCDHEDDSKPTTRNRCRPPEEIECECETEDERIAFSNRRNSRNRDRDNRPKRPCDDKDDICGSRPKNRQDQGKGKREVCPAFCTDDTCPYSQRRPSCREPCASPKRKSPSRKCPRPRDDTTDCDKPKKGCSSLQRPKKKTMDGDVCECSSDENNYGRSNRARENTKYGHRRNDRNESYKNNARSQRGYDDIDDDCDCCEECSAKRAKKNMNDYMDGCACSSDSDEYTRKRDRPSSRRCESPRNGKKYKETGCKRPTSKSNSPCRQSKRNDAYESECECQSNIPKRYDNKQSSRKPEYKPKGTDVYDSEYDCCFSCDEKKQRSERKPSPYCPRSKIENARSSRSEKRTCRKNADTGQNKYPQNNPTNDAMSIENQFEGCECECECIEDNATLRGKCDQIEDICTCTCSAPFEPQVTQSGKRNPAGNGSPFDDKVGIEAIKLDTTNNTWQGSYKLNIDLPFSEETKLDQAPECNASLPGKKKKTRPGSVGPSKNVRSSKVKSAAASPTRNSAPPKTQTGATAKKRTTSRARRTTDTSGAAHSKLLNDLNSASYFICKLQDDDNSKQYLIVVPKKPVARCDTRRDDPGQGFRKQLHCQQQFSGFQSVSWANSASNSAFPSPPIHPMKEVTEISSYAMPPGMTDTTMGIVKEYLQQTMIAGSSGLEWSPQPVVPSRTMLTTALDGPKNGCHPIDRPSNKPNAEIPTENPVFLLTDNPIQNLSLATDKEDVIVLLPPIAGFRSSKNSFSTDAVEVQRITVRNSDTDVNPMPALTKPLPPRPPTKPKRKALL
ncbi:hypothetical protein KR038_004041 [Drosophila bunnanda]|nr:hypothetical protein KR038_004041 [Drosophila bunnanda]